MDDLLHKNRDEMIERMADAISNAFDVGEAGADFARVALDALLSDSALVVEVGRLEDVGYVRFVRDHGADHPVFDTRQVGEPSDPVFRLRPTEAEKEPNDG